MLDTRLLDFHRGTNKQKADPAFGMQVAKSISATVDQGYNGYFTRRNGKIKISREIAAGHQNMTQFLNLMNVDGKNSFVNLDLTPPPIAPKFMDIILQRFMERSEDVKVSAIDPNSRRRQERAKAEAEFRMDNKEMINALQQESGVPVEDPSAYTPEDKDDLEFHFGYEYQLPEEIKFEKANGFVLIDNDWNSVCKRKVIEDLAECGFAVTRTYVDVNGKIKVRVCEPENTFYTWSKFNDLRDTSWCGELYKMKVTEYRARFNDDYVRRYGALAEQKIFEDVAKAAMDCPGYTMLNWNSDWINSYYRPYDDWELEVMDFEFKTVDNDIYTTKTNKYGNLIAVDKRDTMPQRLGDSKEAVVKQVYNIYRGYYVRKLDRLFQWELAKNMIRPQSNLSDVYFSFSFYMYKNREMTNVTLPERMKTSITQMTLAHLKIQQLQAKLRPAGIAVDIDGFQNIDLGLPVGVCTPLQLQAVYDQTGNVYYRSLKDDQETRQMMPIQEMPNAGSVPQIQALITIYNFYLDRLRQDLGTNEYVEGQSVNPKLGLGVMQNQVNASNRATEFIYEGYLSVMQNTCRKISMLLWDNVVFGGKEYRDYIGQQELEEAYFDVNIEMLPDEVERMKIDQKIETALSAGIIEFEDAFKIGNIKNIKLKELYLARAAKRNRQQKIQENQANIEATAQAQQQSAQVTSQGKQQEIQLDYQGKAAVAQMTGKSQSELEMQKFVQDLLRESFKLSKPLPPDLQDIVDGFYNAKAEQEQEEQEMTDMAMQQAAGQQQEQPQPV